MWDQLGPVEASWELSGGWLGPVGASWGPNGARWDQLGPVEARWELSEGWLGPPWDSPGGALADGLSQMGLSRTVEASWELVGG